MELIKPRHLRPGDEVSVVSLSSGIIGEESASFQRVILESKLKELGLKIHYTKNSLKGLDFIKQHPEKRAEDLIEAFSRKTTKIIWSVIGGNDTIRILPFLKNDYFQSLVKKNPKIFMGFSDTTIDHLFLYKLGLTTYYGPALFPDIADPGNVILPYTKRWLSELFKNSKNKEVLPSKYWYRNRVNFEENQFGVPLKREPETHGFEFLNGDGVIQGKLLGGCLESLTDTLNSKNDVFPDLDEWREKVLFIETSEEKPTVEKFKKMISDLEGFGIFNVVNAVLVGKPQCEAYYSEYKNVLVETLTKYSLPFVYNMNFGHAFPRMILPYGQTIVLDFNKNRVFLKDPLFSEVTNVKREVILKK